MGGGVVLGGDTGSYGAEVPSADESGSGVAVPVVPVCGGAGASSGLSTDAVIVGKF